MRRKLAAIGFFAALVCARSALAHRIDEYLQATIFSVEENRVQSSMRLIPGVLIASSVIADIDRDGDGAFSADEERSYSQRVLDDLTITIDATRIRPKLVSWSFPIAARLRDGMGEIHIEYELKLPPTAVNKGVGRRVIVENHHRSDASVYLMNALTPEDPRIVLRDQKRNPKQTRYELDFRQQSGVGVGATPPMPWNQARVWLAGIQVTDLFRLGMRHIAEGSDHLLFLLALLLPAPLLLMGANWGAPAGVRRSLLRIMGIVTAFTVGHSITLSVAAFGAIRVPSRLIEVLIAVSIFVSALHALRPLFPGKEALIAGSFGLIHGVAFAATLDRLGFGRWERLAGILSFNLGIETMQMLVVAAVLPSLMLLSRTPAYPIFRIGGAVFAGAASAGWMVERLFGWNAGVDTFVNACARHSVSMAASLFVISVACRLLTARSAAIVVGRPGNAYAAR